jgi:mRNA interferase MazF
MFYPKRGEIFLVNFDPTIGTEIKKTRPALVIQNNILNKYSSLVIVCPITSTITQGDTRVFVRRGEGGLEYDSIVLTQQVRCVDKKRLIKKLGKLKKTTIKKIDLALKITQGLLPI